ncbi:MAG: 16S rRNA (guanine(527)-N(7))-methyltransferase RsmG, partial [Firmicutes bacterium]|nr:16S rRNA (guanine(527)-N(7))-methyltransferase RsmG [Bacillota bacterium]
MKPELRKMLVEGSASLGVSLKEEQVLLLSAYLEKLREANRKVNITAYKKEEEIILFLFLDSLAVLKLIKEKKAKLIDIGTGGGFPGIPLKIAEPALDITLVDSVEKKIKFLEEVKKIPGLEKLKIINGRAEELARDGELREKFDYAASKALAPLNVLIEYAFPFLKAGGYLIAQKGRGLEKEIKEAVP